VINHFFSDIVLSVNISEKGLDDLHNMTPNNEKHIKWKPIVITTRRHCSLKPNDDSQL